ncbi:MAG TPA: sigma-70 family RNA polymerase sigma factor [Enhygromyxa sp.]|nr:sigma-70 family RNA polymerase sigma factor [Enhygromyxa sp.]
MQVSATAHTSLEPAPPPGFTQLYAEHYDFLWRCALRMGTPAADLEDVVQECFIVALRRFATFDPRGRARASTWLFGILRNVQRNHARAARRRSARLELLAQTSGEEQEPARTAEASLAGRLLDEFLATLDDDKRAAFVLAEIEGMTGPEVADALEVAALCRLDRQADAEARARAQRQPCQLAGPRRSISASAMLRGLGSSK